MPTPTSCDDKLQPQWQGLRDAPWYVRIIANWSPAFVVLTLILYGVYQYEMNKADKILEIVVKHHADADAAKRSLNLIATATQAMCVNAGKTDSERKACLYPQGDGR